MNLLICLLSDFICPWILLHSHTNHKDNMLPQTTADYKKKNKKSDKHMQYIASQ